MKNWVPSFKNESTNIILTSLLISSSILKKKKERISCYLYDLTCSRRLDSGEQVKATSAKETWGETKRRRDWGLFPSSMFSPCPTSPTLPTIWMSGTGQGGSHNVNIVRLISYKRKVLGSKPCIWDSHRHYCSFVSPSC